MHEIPNFLSHEQCDEIIKLIDANHSRSSVVVGGTDRSDITNHRTSSTSNLDPNVDVIKKRSSKNIRLFKITYRKRRIASRPAI